MTEHRETVGKLATDLAQKTPDSQDPIELQREMQKEYLSELWSRIDTDKKIYKDNFYVVVITKNEKLLKNVFRNFFFTRHTCPQPDYDQTVWYYDRKKDELEYIWTIPNKDACIYLLNNAPLVAPEERQIRDFVLDYADGTLYKKMKHLNGEESL